MTNPKDQGSAANSTLQSNAPSWVDEVLGSDATSAAPLSGADNLKIPPASPIGSGRTNSSAGLLSDFVRPLSEKDSAVPANPVASVNPAAPTDPAPFQTPAPTNAWGEPLVARPVSGAAHTPPYTSGEVAQKKLAAGLLAIFLGSLGVHKFYLGMNTPGATMLALNLGVWALAMLLGVLSFGIGLLLTVPLATFVSTVLGIFGLVEGIIYLTKSDSDFERDYLTAKKPWL